MTDSTEEGIEIVEKDINTGVSLHGSGTGEYLTCRLSVASLSLGALSIVLVLLLAVSFIALAAEVSGLNPFLNWIGLLMFGACLFGCLALSLSLLADKKIEFSDNLKGEGLARVGRVLGILGLVLPAASLLAYVGRFRIEKIYQEFFRVDLLRHSFPILLKGLRYTIIVALIAEGCILVTGLLVALMRISRVRTFRVAAATYIDIIRGVPLLLQIFVVYFGLSYLGLNLSREAAGVLALTVCYAAYEAEIFRAGIESIHKGQMEAARSLGMGYLKSMRYIVLPQAVRRVIPPLSNEFIALLKDTALLSVIAVPELLQRAREIMGVKANVTPLVGAAMLYLIVTIPLMFLVRYVERRLARGD